MIDSVIKKVYYTTNEERENAISENSTTLELREECISAEGNFLVFSDDKRMSDLVNDLLNTANLILLKQEGII